jgi:hypothetical protein
VPRLALIDVLDAWTHGRTEAAAQPVIRATFGTRPLAASVAWGVTSGLITTWFDPVSPGDWFTWGQGFFAAFVGSQGWRALRGSATPEEAVRPLLASTLPGLGAMVGVQLLLAVLIDPTAWLVEGSVAELGLHAMGQLTWSLVLLGALMASRRWLQTLVDLFVAWLVLYVSIGVTFWVFDLIGDLTLGLFTWLLSWAGLQGLGHLMQAIDGIADLAFVAGVQAWVAGAAWLTACEVLPERLLGSPTAYVRSLRDFLDTTR